MAQSEPNQSSLYCVAATIAVRAQSAEEARERVAESLRLLHGFVDHAWCDRHAEPCTGASPSQLTPEERAAAIAETLERLADLP